MDKILFLANNLYGYAMVQMLPEKNFRWLTSDEVNLIDFTNVKKDSPIGYILEVDLDYPKELHYDHKDYPLAPEKLTISNDKLSEYQLTTINEMKIQGYHRHPTEKLLLTLYDKKNYILHYENLKLYVRLGLKL